jgi:hypothetical protein
VVIAAVEEGVGLAPCGPALMMLVNVGGVAGVLLLLERPFASEDDDSVREWLGGCGETTRTYAVLRSEAEFALVSAPVNVEARPGKRARKVDCGELSPFLCHDAGWVSRGQATLCR